MKRGPSPTSTTAEHLLGGVQRVRTRVRGFAPWSPEKATLALLDQVRGVLDEYAAHLPLTIRQIFYRLVGAHDYEKTERAYQRLAEHLNRARRARSIPMDVIRDDGRRPRPVRRLDVPGLPGRRRGIHPRTRW